MVQLLHSVLSDREEVQLHTLLTLYCCTLCCQTERRYNCTHYYSCILAHCAVRERGGTAGKLLTLYCCTLCSQTQRSYSCTHYQTCTVAHCAARQRGVKNAHITNPVLLHTVLSDREELQLHTLLTLYCCTLCCQRERRYNYTHY